jgi:hypothetical protein
MRSTLARVPDCLAGMIISTFDDFKNQVAACIRIMQLARVQIHVHSAIVIEL